STIQQHASAIESKVSTVDYNGNNIASLINQTATTIKIQASKINLVGAVTVLSDITGNLGTITAGTLRAVRLEAATGTFSGELTSSHVRITGRQLSFNAHTDRVGIFSDYTTSTGYHLALGKVNSAFNWSNLDNLELMANNVSVGGTITASGYKGTFDVRNISVVGGSNRTILHDHGNSNVSLSATGNL
ncbi:hypothetical protein ACWE42_25480, partial [Sutcliffiella cohnii]